MLLSWDNDPPPSHFLGKGTVLCMRVRLAAPARFSVKVSAQPEIWFICTGHSVELRVEVGGPQNVHFLEQNCLVTRLTTTE